MDKAKHGEASYLQFISDAKYNRAESDARRRKSCGQSRRRSQHAESWWVFRQNSWRVDYL